MNLPERIYAKIDLDAIAHNLRAAKNKTNRDVLAVIKANGYGHGALPIARRLSREGLVWGYGVATAGEAMQLRRGGIEEPILILGATFALSWETLIEHDVRLTVFDVDTAKEISAAAARVGKCALLHLKADTGMGRIGLRTTEAEIDSSVDAACEIAALPDLKIEGLFTHFACADEFDKNHTKGQMARFLAFKEKLDDRGVKPSRVHMCNSAAVIDFDIDFLDMVRFGISVYGLYPSDEVVKENVNLIPAMSLYSHVAHVKHVNPGDSVSYGAMWHAEQECVIATIPVGYADGYPRLLSGKARVMVRGVSLPIVGRVCMDQFMVDATALPDIKVGDEVTLMGEGITAEELAALAGTINYELVCGIAPRVPRVYYECGEVAEIVDPLAF
ncbi:MAG: alanine racemase [Clostridia bacterium]|nr:alanine racemase [Clostridia bacterium]